MTTTTVSTIMPSGGNYTSLSAWNTSRRKNLVTADAIEIADCFPMVDSSAVYMSQWTCDATRYPTIRANAAHRHAGVYDSAQCYCCTGGINIYVNLNIVIDGLCFGVNGSAVNTISGTTTSIITVKNCVLKGATYANGIVLQNGTALTCYIYNNIGYGFSGPGGDAGSYAGISLNNGTFYCYNNTMINCSHGFKILGGTCVAKNNLVSAYYTNYSGTFAAGSDYNVSSDGTGPGANSVTGTCTFVNAAANNFLLDSADTVAKKTGTPLSGDANLSFTTDILGLERGATWSRGASDFASKTTTQKDTSWHVINKASVNTSWVILYALVVAAIAWAVYTRVQKTSAWKALVRWQSITAWSILTSGLFSGTAWRVLARKSTTSSWKIFAAITRAVSWGIYTAVAAVRAVEWAVLAGNSKTASWKVLNVAAKTVAWRVLSVLDKASTWAITSVKTVAMSWRVLEKKTANSAWRLLSKVFSASEWRILTAKTRSVAWGILTKFTSAATWKVFNKASEPTSWRALTIKESGASWGILASLRSFVSWCVTVTIQQLIAWRTGVKPEGLGPEVLMAQTPITRTIYAYTPIVREMNFTTRIS